MSEFSGPQNYPQFVFVGNTLSLCKVLKSYEERHTYQRGNGSELHQEVNWYDNLWELLMLFVH